MIFFIWCAYRYVYAYGPSTKKYTEPAITVMPTPTLLAQWRSCRHRTGIPATRHRLSNEERKGTVSPSWSKWLRSDRLWVRFKSCLRFEQRRLSTWGIDGLKYISEKQVLFEDTRRQLETDSIKGRRRLALIASSYQFDFLIDFHNSTIRRSHQQIISAKSWFWSIPGFLETRWHYHVTTPVSFWVYEFVKKQLSG